MSRLSVALVGLTVLVFGSYAWSVPYSFTETFGSDPFVSGGGDWSITTGTGFAPDTYSQFTWNSSTASKYSGDPVGSLQVVYDSNKPNIRLQRDLGMSLTTDRDFTLSTRMTILSQDFSAPEEGYFQITFALANSSTTGPGRVSYPANSFDNVEFCYFPNVTAYGGPTLQGVVMGAEVGGNAFDNWASPIFADGDLEDNTGSQINALPLNTPLEAVLSYDRAAQLLSLTMFRVSSDGSLTQLLLSDTGAITTDLSGAVDTFDPSKPFTVDSLIISSYFDEWKMMPEASLFARVDYDGFTFAASEPMPEPMTMLLVGSGFLTLVGVHRRRRCR